MNTTVRSRGGSSVESDDDKPVPVYITGPGVAHVELLDVLRSKRFQEQLEEIDVLFEKGKNGRKSRK